jgi:hypothetical protein
VQSVAVRLVVEREREIEAFVPRGVLDDLRRRWPSRRRTTGDRRASVASSPALHKSRGQVVKLEVHDEPEAMAVVQ